jgi:hypothetical protein
VVLVAGCGLSANSLQTPLAAAPSRFAAARIETRDAQRSSPASVQLVSDSLPPRNDEDRAAAAGIRILKSRHLTLLTDLPKSRAVDKLPEVFDLAFPQWCAYFEQDAARLSDWHVTGCVIRDKALFRDAGLIPDNLPPFLNGYCMGSRIWVYDQPSDYYRRHLVLHEGTHSFMFTVLGGCGPPWYMEGTAELLGTHRWKDGRLELNYIPANREESLMWGRVKIVQDDFAAHRAKTLKGVIQYGPTAHREVGPYGWCWAAALLLDHHPRYRGRFRELRKFVREADFSDRFLQSIGGDWDDLAEEWQVFVAELEYGVDIPRTAIQFTRGRPPLSGGAEATVAADRGWQSSGIALEAGMSYRLRAAGRYQVASQPKIWWSEPNGVSIRYYRGRPLGMLLAAVHPDHPRIAGPSPLLTPIPVGLGMTLVPKRSGTLMLRINHSNAELSGNAGSLRVVVEAVGRDE